jgi:hypothetical protein
VIEWQFINKTGTLDAGRVAGGKKAGSFSKEHKK